ncbi:MAG: arsenate reductase ArsC [Chitinophagaceae bacterium]
MKNILVLCTGNSCRSQIAEGYLRRYAGNKAVIYSAGVEAHGLNPRAVAVMQQDGIDISAHTSNVLTEYTHLHFDIVITVCDHAKTVCPVWPGTALVIHHNFPDPARATGTEAEIDAAFIQVRDQIKEYCRAFVQEYLSA